MSHDFSAAELLDRAEPETRVSEASRALESQFDRIMREHGPAISRLAASYERVASSVALVGTRRSAQRGWGTWRSLLIDVHA